MAVGKISLGILLRYLLALMLALVVLIPLVMTVFGGLKSTGDLLSDPIGWPDRFHWENFDGILQNPSFWLQMRNSLFVMLATAIGSVFLSSMPAFSYFCPHAFSPATRNRLQFFYLGVTLSAGRSHFAALYFTRELNLIDSHWGFSCRKLRLGCPAQS